MNQHLSERCFVDVQVFNPLTPSKSSSSLSSHTTASFFLIYQFFYRDWIDFRDTSNAVLHLKFCIAGEA